MRERYEDWCGAWRDALAHKREVGRLIAAEAKRERKAARRRRDAELTRLGHQARGAWAMIATHWRRDHDRGVLWLRERMALLRQMRAIRRGEVQP